MLQVSRPEAFHHTGTPTVLRLAAVPERRRRLASPFAVWAPDETAARAFVAAGFPDDRVSILPPFLPRVAPGPGGRGILAVLPSHLPRLAEATARALAPLAGERELRLALTVATPELREAAAGWAPGAEVLPRPLREHELTREARDADAVVVLDPDDGFQRGILAAAGSGAAVVARPGGAAESVLGAALATCADAASEGAVRAAVEAALAGAADRDGRAATVAAACSGPAWQSRLADLLDAARSRAVVRRPRPPRAPAEERPAVLVVAGEPPDLRARTVELRTAGLLRSLARLGHAPILLCSDAKLRDDVAEELWEDGVEVCFGDRAGLDRRGLLRRRFGAVVFPELAAAARSIRATRHQFPGVRIVIDGATAQFPRTDEHAAFLGTDDARAAAETGRASELQVLRHADLVLAPGLASQALMAGLLPGVPVGLLPSVQDVPVAAAADGRRGVALLHDWSRPESGYAVQALCQDVLPVLRRRGFDEPVALVGPGLRRDLVRVARESGVEPVGYAPDLSRQLAAFRATLAPAPFDGGTGARLGASLANGLPVVATPPAAATLDEQRGVLVGATPDELTGHLLALAADPALFARLSADAQAHAADRLSAARVDAELHEALSYLLQPRAVEVA